MSIIKDVPTRPEYSTGKQVRSIRTCGSVLAKIATNQATQATKNAIESGFHTFQSPEIADSSQSSQRITVCKVVVFETNCTRNYTPRRLL